MQCFFAWRVKVLTNSLPAVFFIATCAIVQFCKLSMILDFVKLTILSGGGLGTSIAVGMIPEFIHFQKFEVIVIIWLAFSAVADCSITFALVWHLVRGWTVEMNVSCLINAHQRKHKTGFVATDDIVNRIIRRASFYASSMHPNSYLVCFSHCSDWPRHCCMRPG